MKPRTSIVAFVTIAALRPAVLLAQPVGGNEDTTAVAAIERTLVDAIARVEPSVVAISRRTPGEEPPLALQIGDAFGEFRPTQAGAERVTTGAGVIIDPAGLVLTQYLVVRDGDEHTVTTTDGKTYSAIIKAADPRSSLAVLAIQASPLQRAGEQTKSTAPRRTSFPALSLGDADALRKGQFIIAVSNPYAIQTDGEPTASWGIVTNLARKAPAGANLNDAPGPAEDHRTTLHHLGTLIQTDAKLGWSAGGGALVNLHGELIGITTTVAAIAGHEQPAGYAIPMSAAMRTIIDTLKEGREVEYGLLGISFGFGQVDSTDGGNERVIVQNVVPHTPAARAGFSPGDIITHVDGRPIDDVDDIQLAISLRPPMTTAQIKYERRGEKGSANVTLAKLPIAGSKISTNRPSAWRGIQVDHATPLSASVPDQTTINDAYDPQGCVAVVDVEQNSEAWQAGVRAGMFISHVSDTRVTTPNEFREAVKLTGNFGDLRFTQPVQPAADEAKVE